jgi:hypothetical protein
MLKVAQAAAAPDGPIDHGVPHYMEEVPNGERDIGSSFDSLFTHLTPFEPRSIPSDKVRGSAGATVSACLPRAE